MYFLSVEVKSVKRITFILSELWVIIQLFNGEHRTKVVVHCVGHVFVSGDNNYIQSFEYPVLCITILASVVASTVSFNAWFHSTFFLH